MPDAYIQETRPSPSLSFHLPIVKRDSQSPSLIHVKWNSTGHGYKSIHRPRLSWRLYLKRTDRKMPIKSNLTGGDEDSKSPRSSISECLAMKDLINEGRSFKKKSSGTLSCNTFNPARKTPQARCKFSWARSRPQSSKNKKLKPRKGNGMQMSFNILATPGLAHLAAQPHKV